jgi:hypothetical protein
LDRTAIIFLSFDEIENFLLENCINDDLLITMGAGDVVKIGENLSRKSNYPHYPHFYEENSSHKVWIFFILFTKIFVIKKL